VDLPPVNEVTDAMTVSRCLDGMLCTVNQGYTKKVDLETAMRYMSYSNTETIGFVINNAKTGGKYGYHGYKYGYEQ
jgi:Mrp family chromosome partitioning ATPase